MRLTLLTGLLIAVSLPGAEASFKERVATWPLDDFAGLVKWVRANDAIAAMDKSDLLRSRGIDLVNQRTELAMAGILLLTEEERAGLLNRLLAERLAAVNLDKAGLWLTQQTTLPAAGEAIEGLLASWMKADLATVIRTVGAWPDPAARDRLLMLITWEWAKTDPRAAADWATMLPGSVRVVALGDALHKLRQEAANEAYARISGLAAGKDRDAIALRVVGDVIVDPAAAARWSASYPDADVAAQLVRALARTQARQIYLCDAAAATSQANAWIDGIEQVALRDAAREAAVDGMLANLTYPKPSDDPAALRALIDPIQQAAVREAVMQRAEKAWNRRFPDKPLR